MTLINYNCRKIIFHKYTRAMFIKYDAYIIAIEQQASNTFTNYDDNIIIDKTSLNMLIHCNAHSI